MIVIIRPLCIRDHRICTSVWRKKISVKWSGVRRSHLPFKTPFNPVFLQTFADCLRLSSFFAIINLVPGFRGIFAFGGVENGSWVRLVFCVVVVLFVCLFVCLLQFLVFLNRNFSSSNGLFCLYSLHQIPCDIFCGGGAGRGGGAGGAGRREMGLILNCEWKKYG